MLFAWQQDGWFSDQLNELAILEAESGWLADLLSAIDTVQPVLQTVVSPVSASLADKDTDDVELIQLATIGDDDKSLLDNLAERRGALEKLISRQRQFNQNW
jgi:hypothetical protein